MHLRSPLVTFAALVALFCTPNRSEQKPVVVCTLLGCTNGVVVHLSSHPQTTFRVQLVPHGGTYGTTYVFNCERANQCPDDIMFPGIITESASITVTTPAGSRETSVAGLVYTTRYPNGQHCGPECRQVKITAQLPE
jgi:hypothetical protein